MGFKKDPGRNLVAAGNCKMVCSVSYRLKNSKLNLNCSDDNLKELTELSDSKRRDILLRTLDDSTGEGKNICNDHLLALTDNLNRQKKCLAEYHEGERRLPPENTARIVSPDYSKHIYESTHGFILPSGTYICKKCRTDIAETNPPPKRPKLEPKPKVQVCDKGDTQKTPREETKPPDYGNMGCRISKWEVQN